MADPIDRHPIDDGAAEPAQNVIKVKGCEGCGGLPHSGPTATIDCLHKALARERAIVAELRHKLAFWGRS